MGASRQSIERRRLGYGPVPQLQQRQHVSRIEDLRAPAERPGVLRDHLRADGDRHTVVIQLHPYRPVGMANRYRIGDVVARRKVGLQLRDEQRIERRPALHRQPRPERQIADTLDARLDRTLFLALRRRAELGPKRIGAPERREHLGLQPVPAGQHLLDR